MNILTGIPMSLAQLTPAISKKTVQLCMYQDNGMMGCVRHKVTTYVKLQESEIFY